MGYTFFEEEDCEELLERAQELGIEVKGTTFEAWQIAEEFYALDYQQAKERSALREVEELLGEAEDSEGDENEEEEGWETEFETDEDE